MRRGVLGIVGAQVVKAERTPCPKKPIVISPRIDRLSKRLTGKKIEGVDRLGKRVVVGFDSGDRLIFEPRMTGLVLIADPPTTEHLRFCLHLRKCSIKKLLYWDRRGLGNVSLLSDKQYQAKLTDGKLGPDALRFHSKSSRNGLVKADVTSKSRCLINRPCWELATCTPARYCIWPASIRRLVAIVSVESVGR